MEELLRESWETHIFCCLSLPSQDSKSRLRFLLLLPSEILSPLWIMKKLRASPSMSTVSLETQLELFFVISNWEKLIINILSSPRLPCHCHYRRSGNCSSQGGEVTDHKPIISGSGHLILTHFLASMTFTPSPPPWKKEWVRYGIFCFSLRQSQERR